MKYNLAAVSLLLLCIQHTIFTMDTELQPIYTRVNSSEQLNTCITLDEMISVINNAINKKFPKNNYFFNMFTTQLTEEGMFDVIKTIYECYGKHCIPSNDLIAALYLKNDFFKQAIEHFITHARTNLENVTGANLSVIADPTMQQPIPQLNHLTPAIRAYCMNRALRKINHTIDIVLPEQMSTVHYDIHSEVDLLVTSSSNGIIHLWNLATGKYLYTLPGIFKPTIVRFDFDGLQLLTLTTENQIKIWDIDSRKALYIIEQPTPILDALFTKNESDAQLAIFSPTNCKHQSLLSLYTLSKNQKPKPSKPIIVPFQKKHLNLTYQGNYRSFIEGSKLMVSKKHCDPLWFCEQATQKSGSFDIKKTPVYKQLTPYEQDIIDKKIATSAISASSQK